MSVKSLTSSLKTSKKNCVILILIGFFAIHNLVYHITFRFNLPYGVDIDDVFFPVFQYIVNGEFTLLINKDIHIIFFPKLLSYLNFYFNSFDVVNITYVYWIITSITLFVLYLIIKQTDKKLFWTLVPISAFLYSTLTTSGGWSLGMLAWYIPMLGITSIVYLLNKKNINSKIFTSSIFLGVFSTFSILLGVVSWIAGLFILLKPLSEKQFGNRKWIVLWIVSSLISGFCYLLLTSGNDSPINFQTLFSFTGLSFISNFIASSFRLKFEILMFLVGIFSISLSIFYFWLIIKKNLLKEYFPWFVFLFSAFCGAIITTLGRAHLEHHLGNEPYYTTISQLFQISLIVITGKLILEFNQNSKALKRKILVYTLILIILSQMLLLIPSYYSSWVRGEHYLNEKMDFANCFSLYPNPDCLERMLHWNSNHDDNFLPMINYLIENDLSLFGESRLNNEEELLKKFQNFDHLPQISSINNFEYINENKIIDTSNYILDSEILSINGWFLVDSNSIPQNLFLLLDEKPILEKETFEMEYYSENDSKTKISWSIFFLTGYLEIGCHEIHLIGITEHEKINLENTLVVCKNS